MKTNIEKVKLSYEFFKNMANKQESFILSDVSLATRWSISTIKTYLSKKWSDFIIRDGKVFYIDSSCFSYSEEEYIRMMSQVKKNSSNPYKPDFSIEVEELLIKAKEAAILAIDIYNRPMTLFRSQGFIVMMIIAWTSLLHALFENENKDYYYYRNGKVVEIDGDKKAWELDKCIKNCDDITISEKENLKFFIKIRNKIEHRYSPSFDLDICGECQALLFNFEELITAKFGTYYSLNNTLSIPLQVITNRPPWQSEITKKFHGKNYNELKDYITAYRKDLPEEIYTDPKYSFNVYLIPKTVNHQSSSDTTIEFIKYDPEHPEKYEGIEKQIALIREKRVPVANLGNLKPKDVSAKVQEQIDKKFTLSTHTKAWKYYKVRKQGHQPEGCETEYCQFDEAHNDYVYTQAWVDFLIKKLSDIEEYNKVIDYR